MKKTNILDFFKSQTSKVSCPACGIPLLKSKLNNHLDSLCASALSTAASSKIVDKVQSPQKSSISKRRVRNAVTTSSRLCLKGQRSKNSSKNSESFFDKSEKERSKISDDEIVIVEELKASPKKLKRHQTEESIKNNPIGMDSKKGTNDISSAKNSCSLSDDLNKDSTVSLTLNNINTRKVYEKETNVVLRNRTTLKRKKPLQNESCDGSNSPDGTKKVTNTTSKRKKSLQNESCNGSNSPDATKQGTNATSKRKKSKSNESVSNDKKSGKTNILSDSELLINGQSSKEIDDSIITLVSQNKNKNSETYVKNISNSSLSNEKSHTENKTIFRNELNPDLTDILNDAKQISENDVFSELSDSAEVKDSKSYTPYYIANFKYILEAVLNDQDNQILFNDEDQKNIKAFKAASDAAQKIYVRLFQRKYKWLRINRINYPDITKDPLMSLEELARSGLVDSGACEIELDTALELLSLPEAKSLAKHFNFNSAKNKSDIKQMLLKHCKEHKSVFFTNGNNGVSGMMLKKVRSMLGPCYRMSLLPKRLFTRVLMLFSLPTISEDDDEAAGGQQQQLLTLLQVNKGELVFPVCKRKKETVIFSDRDELIRYEEARQLENDIFNSVESKNFELAKELYLNAKKEFEEQCSCTFSKRASSLPPFLKRYTSFHVYIRCMTQGVEALQKLRQYDEAVTLLKKLLKQKVYCQDYKGRWYDRLALNLEQHLKKPQSALEAIKRGLKDKNVRVGHQYSLLTRALRITKSFDEEDEFRKQILKDSAVREAPKVTIQGRLCPRSILGRRHVFISSSVSIDEDDVTVLGVEQLALEHYKEEGFPEGVHGEGSTFISLYALLFWDIIYDDNIPDVFISPHQTHPLDLNSEAFFMSREDQIMNHLETLRKSSNEELKEIVKSTWERHHGKASLISWDRFSDLEHVQGLVCCFGSHVLSGICERLAKDFRFTRSGVPDLVVWNPDTLCAKIVEVKGPGDKLSSKQILWLDCLIKLGADAEVCLVEAVASKKLRK